MAKQKQKVICTSYIRVDGELVSVDSLNKQQRDYLGAKIQESILNTMYRGEVDFKAQLPPVETVFPKSNKGYL